MPEEIRFGVIAAAGRGERMNPITRIVPKELFPLGRIPVIGHIACEFAEAGVTDIVIVAGPHNYTMIREILTPRPIPVKVTGDPVVRRFQDALSLCSYHFIVQDGNYGNGTPLRLASERYGIRNCLYAFGDDLVIGCNASAGLLQTYRASDCTVLGCQSVAPERQGAFGILECELEDGIQRIKRIVEKPVPGQTASTLASFGRYVVTQPVIDILAGLSAGKDDEVWFVDAVQAHIDAGGRACAFRPTSGAWHTVGDPAGYADAVQALAQEASRYINCSKAAIQR